MSDSGLNDFYSSENAHNWEQLHNFHENRLKGGAQWVFRGQGNHSWGLTSSLERQVTNLGLDQSDAPDIERGLLRRFKRQCHQYVDSVPGDNERLEWMALMQHHGAPTRILDWTYSFFVALFFALEDADKDGCAVWALNADWMKQPFEAILASHPAVLQSWKCDPRILLPGTFASIFLRYTPIPLVAAVNPQRLNQRLVIQQGVFLCPGDVSKTFEANLAALFSQAASEATANFIKLTIRVDPATKRHILLRLHSMNMNSATLFPGLDGFARSLKTLMADSKKLLHPGYEYK